MIYALANFGVGGGQGGAIQSLALKIHVICDYYEMIMNYSYLFKPLPWLPHPIHKCRTEDAHRHTRSAPDQLARTRTALAATVPSTTAKTPHTTSEE